MEAKRTYDLEERLIEFAVMIANIVQEIRRTRIGNYVAGQITRSGFSPAFNYGEAQAGESRQDFIHKLKIHYSSFDIHYFMLRLTSLLLALLFLVSCNKRDTKPPTDLVTFPLKGDVVKIDKSNNRIIFTHQKNTYYI